MISTRTGDPDDPFNEMLYMKYDDISEEEIKKGANPFLFNSLVWDSVCDECRASGVEASHCVHREIERPPWIRKNNRFLRRVMMLDPEAYKTEILGLVEGGASTPAFDKTAVGKIFTKEKIFRGRITSKYIFIGTDPCGMNTTGKSLYSSIAIAFVDHKPVILGAEATNFRKFEKDPIHVKMFAEAIRQRIPGAQQCTLVFGSESNYGKEAAHIEAVLSTSQQLDSGSILLPMKNYHVLRQERGFVGILTNNANKRNSADVARTHINCGNIFIHENAFTNSPGGWPQISNMMFDQWTHFRRILKVSQDGRRVTETYSGKDHGPDDLTMALLLTLYTHGSFTANLSLYE